ncbi:hypothetical protein ACS0TY_020810 [Phlomoides rotata]
MLGHMKMGCGLIEEEENVTMILDEKLPFGEWLRASPSKQVTVFSEARRMNTNNTSLRRQLFECFKESVKYGPNLKKQEGEEEETPRKPENKEVAEVRSSLERVVDIGVKTDHERAT